MKNIIIVGNGNRADVYGGYILEMPDKAKIVGVVDPNPFKRDLAKERYGIADDMCFENVETLCKKGKIADAIFNCTMDNIHVQTTLPLIELGYDILLEKPITSSREELELLQSKAKEKGVVLMICHLLRYTPFYSSIKKLILEGEIGEIRHMETSENVGILHSSNAYIRGKWGNKERCGSSMLLAKCCHDLDYICWLNNATTPYEVFSFGGRDYFIPENAPKGAGTRCLVDCKCEKDCIFSAKKDYLDNDHYPEYAWQCIDKKPEDISYEERVESLKTNNPHGVCAFKTDSDIVDHQTVLLRFKNGSTAVHNMITAVPRYGRTIHIVGTQGEIDGYLDGNKFELRKFDEVSGYYSTQVFDVSKENDELDFHFGGDKRLVDDFVAILYGERPSICYTGIEDSINSHYAVYCADESMESGKVIKIKK